MVISAVNAIVKHVAPQSSECSWAVPDQENTNVSTGNDADFLASHQGAEVAVVTDVLEKSMWSFIMTEILDGGQVRDERHCAGFAVSRLNDHGLF